MNIAKHPPCAPNCPLRGEDCHAGCEKYAAWKAELQRINAARDREKQADQGVVEVQLHRKEWLRRRGYKNTGGVR